MDEMFTEKTMAADQIDQELPQADAEGFERPYPAYPQEEVMEYPPQYQPPQYQPPQYRQPQYQPPQYPQYQPPQYQPPQYQPPQYQPPQYQPPQYDPQQYQPPQYQPQQYDQFNQPVPVSKAARVFSILSFVFGCIVAFFLLTLLVSSKGTDIFNYSSSSSSAKGTPDIVGGVVLAIPGLVFGIIALAKKTTKFPLALLGTVFNGIFLLFCLIAATITR